MTGGTSPGSAGMSAALPVLPVLTLVLRNRRLVVVLPFLTAVMFVAWTALTRGFEVSATFLPRTSSAVASRFSSLAAQLGFGAAAAPRGESMDFYAKLVKSRELLTAAVRTTFVVARFEGSADSLRGTLVDLLGADGATEQERVSAAVADLADHVAVRADFATSIVTVTVGAPTPLLAEAVCDRILSLVDEFNLQRRQSQAAAERQFVEQRVSAARAALRAAESRLQEFFERNRSYRESAALVFEAERLQRDVDLKTSILTTLVQAYEQARIDEVRNTPSVTVVEPPAGAAVPEVRLLVMAVLGGLFGLVVVLAIVLAREWAATGRADAAVLPAAGA